MDDTGKECRIIQAEAINTWVHWERFALMISGKLISIFVEIHSKNYSMEKLCKTYQRFQSIAVAPCAVSVVFQKAILSNIVL